MKLQRGVSLNAIWDRFDAAGRARSDGNAEDDFELTTPITVSLPDGRQATAILCILHGDDAPPDHFGVQIDLDTTRDGEGDWASAYKIADMSLIDLQAPWQEGWKKPSLIAAFNIDPDSPIWDTEDELAEPM